jgi:hypothetical protein
METRMRKGLFFAVFLMTLAAGSQSVPGRFDGMWNTTVVCDAKSNASGYTWHFVSTVTGNVLHGERGTAGQNAYLAIDGKIENDGKAKLKASGITGSKEYTHAPTKVEGEGYGYEVKSVFTDMEGKGERSTGLGIAGRPCHYAFEKLPAGAPAEAKP